MLEAYNAQIYLEDDIGFTKECFDYCIQYKDICIFNGYNLGFVRVERRPEDDTWFCTDLLESPPGRVPGGSAIRRQRISLHCFWIYDRDKLTEFTRSKDWAFEDWEAHRTHSGVRERAASGWYAPDIRQYRATLVPLEGSTTRPTPFITQAGSTTCPTTTSGTAGFAGSLSRSEAGSPPPIRAARGPTSSRRVDEPSPRVIEKRPRPKPKRPWPWWSPADSTSTISPAPSSLSPACRPHPCGARPRRR